MAPTAQAQPNVIDLHDHAPHARRRAAAVAAELTTRELTILELMAAGHSNRAIRHELWLSPKTVESHRRSIFMKLGLQLDGSEDRRVAAVLAYLDARAA